MSAPGRSVYAGEIENDDRDHFENSNGTKEIAALAFAWAAIYCLLSRTMLSGCAGSLCIWIYFPTILNGRRITGSQRM